jgi:hypothetical protein
MRLFKNDLMEKGFFQTGQYLRFNKVEINIYYSAKDDLYLLANDETILIEACDKENFTTNYQNYLANLYNSRQKVLDDLKNNSKPIEVKNKAQFTRLLETNVKITTLFHGTDKPLTRLGLEVLGGLKGVSAKELEFNSNHIVLGGITHYFLAN